MLTNWKDIKTSQFILEFWSREFNKIGSCEFDKSKDIVHYQDNMMLTLNLDNDDQTIEFWDIIFESTGKKQYKKFNKGE